MKRRYLMKLSLSIFLLLSCIGVLYITNITLAENSSGRGKEAGAMPKTYPALSEELIYELQGAGFEDYSLEAGRPALIKQPHHRFVLLNKQNYLPADFVPENLTMPGIPFTGGAGSRKLLVSVAATAVEQLVAAAAQEGVVLNGVSAYRSIDYQKEVYARNVKKYGQKHADQYSSVAGYSEHHSGLCIDISSPSVGNALEERLGKAREGQWLAANAHRYGFIIRYPKGKEAITGYAYEPWHIRYLGVPLATYLYENDLCYEEFIGLVQSGQLLIPEKPLAQFSDRDVLKTHPYRQALELLTVKGGLLPDAENRLQPEQPISRQEFLAAALQWLSQIRPAEAADSPVAAEDSQTAAESQTIAEDQAAVKSQMIDEKQMQADGQTAPDSQKPAENENKTTEQMAPEGLPAQGFTVYAELLERADGYGVALLADTDAGYDQPLSRAEAAMILAALAERALGESHSPAGQLQDYFTDAFLLRSSPYQAAIEQMTAAGVISNAEFQPFSAAASVTRAEAAVLLMRLFQPADRQVNQKLEIERLNDLTDDYQSKAMCLFNNETKTFVWQKNETMRLAPASLTKLMTVYLALQEIPDLQQKVSIAGAYRSRVLRFGASIAGFSANEKVSYEDLAYAALLASGAEAAGTLAIRTAGKEALFIEAMNQKAAEWGMNDTHFQTVEGLDAEGQYTTAKDMIIFLEKALQDPRFYRIFTTAAYTTSKTWQHPGGLRLTSTVLSSISPSEEKGFHIIGGKSGTTGKAGLCWATLALKKETPYLLVTLGAPLDNIYKPTKTQKADALKIYERVMPPLKNTEQPAGKN